MESVERSCIAMGKDAKPTYALIDSQIVKITISANERGTCGGKTKVAQCF